MPWSLSNINNFNTLDAIGEGIETIKFFCLGLIYCATIWLLFVTTAQKCSRVLRTYNRYDQIRNFGFYALRTTINMVIFVTKWIDIIISFEHLACKVIRPVCASVESRRLNLQIGLWANFAPSDSHEIFYENLWKSLDYLLLCWISSS